jgi:hypothetical protein
VPLADDLIPRLYPPARDDPFTHVRILTRERFDVRVGREDEHAAVRRVADRAAELELAVVAPELRQGRCSTRNGARFSTTFST